MFELRWSSKQACSSTAALLNLATCLLLLLPKTSAASKALDGDYLQTASAATVYAKKAGGMEASSGRFPYVCSLRERSSHAHACGAALFRQGWVLTAAHCVDPKVDGSVGLTPIVDCGTHGSTDSEKDKVFNAVAGYVHPAWTGDVAGGHDVAVLKLDRDANLPLPSLGSGNVPLFSEDDLAAAGWATTEFDDIANTMLVADRLVVVDQGECKERLRGIDSDSWICARSHTQTVGKGESGGPLIWAADGATDEKTTAGMAHRDSVVGIASFGYALQGSEQNSREESVVYTKVDYYLDWIESTVNTYPTVRTKQRTQLSSSCATARRPLCVDRGRGYDKKLMEKKKAYEGKSEAEMISAMIAAVKTDNYLDAEAILLNGLYVDTPYGSAGGSGLSEATGSTFLHAAATLNAVECAKVLLKHCARVDSRDSLAVTPLATAANHNRHAVLKVLLNHGADINAINADGMTPLYLATVKNLNFVVQLLVEHGAEVNTTANKGWTPLYEASENGHTNIAKILVEAGADLNTYTYGFWTPLTGSIYGGYPQIAKIVIEAGVKLNNINRYGKAPLHLAVNRNLVQITKMLVDHGAEIEVLDEAGRTPLHLAALYGRFLMAKILVDAGAIKAPMDNDAATPLDLVCKDKNAKCSEKVREAITGLLSP